MLNHPSQPYDWAEQFTNRVLHSTGTLGPSSKKLIFIYVNYYQQAF